MTHSAPLDDSAGKFFTEWVESATRCPKCNEPMKCQLWESGDGAYEDHRYTCENPACGYVRWVDGIDS